MEYIKEKIIIFVKENYKKITIIGIILILFITSLILINNKYNSNSVVVQEDNIKLSDNKDIELKEEVEEKKYIYIDVKGAVSKPGVYKLEEGSIVNDALKAAGGVLKSSNTREINLSKKLKDEMVIIIYTNSEIDDFKNSKEEIEECICDKDINESCVKESYSNSYVYNSSVSSSNKTYSSYESKNSYSSESINNLININTASLEELLSLTGIGESKAKAIIEYRKETPFEVIEDIMKVSGIGQSVFDKIKENITV